MEVRAVRIDPRDNVAVVIDEAEIGARISGVEGVELAAADRIPRHHKVALTEIPEGGAVIKYGETIGYASKKIGPGQWVHTHNMKWEES